MDSLTILLPVTSRAHAPGQPCLPSLLASLRSLSRGMLGEQPPGVLPSGSNGGAASDEGGSSRPQLSVCIGIDEDDCLLAAFAADLQRCFPPPIASSVCILPLHRLAQQRQRCGGASPLCWIWSQLAEAAWRAFQPGWTLLLGDDTTVQPAGWPQLLADFLAARPHLRCVGLLDSADPGFPSFLAVASSHLQLMGRMLPGELCNQGGDPLLYELYRSFGAAAMCPHITVHNGAGGPQGSPFAPPAGQATPPRYTPRPLPIPDWCKLLGCWRAELQSKAPGLAARRRLQVGVAVPTYRVNPAALALILERSACSHPDVDVRVLLQVDTPRPGPDVLAWLRTQRLARLDGLRVRLNSTNQGAAATRNHLLDEAAPCDLIIFFDDDVVPAQHCVSAYVAAFRQHPNAAGFAGPTFLPRRPSQWLPTSIHMSDVTFFWEAPATLAPHVPWAVTANMADSGSAVQGLRGGSVRFRDGFPKTGGGEDVDFCVCLGVRLVAVPGAAAEHPWWPEGRPKVYRRFWRWAEGDGQLVALWPHLSYRRAPNPPELCLLLALLAPLLLASGLASASGLLGCLLALLAADLLLAVLRNCCLAQRRRQHPCAAGWWLRPLAGTEAWLIACLSSEGGRLAGQLKRRQWGSLGRSFDWFCGGLPQVVAGEQRRAAVRCGCCLLAAGACLLAMSGA